MNKITQNQIRFILVFAGLVTPDFKHDHKAGEFYNQLREEIRSIKEQVENAPSSTKDET